MANPRLPIAGPAGRLLGKETLALSIRQMDPVPWNYVENGFVLWEGESPVDGAPLVAIVTGAKDTNPSENTKTGAMLQTWILRRDISPRAAIDSGGDISICGHCPSRGVELEKPKKKKRKTVTAQQAGWGWGVAGGHASVEKMVDTTMEGRICYVVVDQAPQGIFKKYRRGLHHESKGGHAGDLDKKGNTIGYPRMSEQEMPLLGWGRVVRLGSYGDPAMVPERVWRLLVWNSLGWTGYTHQWRDPAVQSLQPFTMASVDNEEEMDQARSMGWRTFRVLRGDEQLIAGTEMSCPASHEAGQTKTCDACQACQGTMPGKKPWRERPGIRSVALKVHPRWTVLYYPRGKRGKRIRSIRLDAPPTETMPKRLPSELILVDYLAGTEVAGVMDLMKRAEKLKDPGAFVSQARSSFPPYLHSYLDNAVVILASKGKVKPRVRPNPTKAENLLAKAVRPCMTREEAHHAATSIERSLSAVQRGKVVPERTRSKILKLTSQARGSKTPKGRIRALAAANRMLQGLRTYGEGSGRQSKGYRRKRGERTDPRLGNLMHGPALSPGALARRRDYAAETQIAANPYRNPGSIYELRDAIDQKRIELGDAIYFNYEASQIADLQALLRDMEEELAELEEGASAAASQSMNLTRHDIERDEWRHRQRGNPRGHDWRCEACGAPAVTITQDLRYLCGECERGTVLRGSGWKGPPPVRSNPLLAVVGNPPVRRNPLLAIVGNPVRGSELKRHRAEASRLIHEALEHHDFDALHEAHEHVQAAYRCCSNPPNPEELGVLDEVLAEIDGAEAVMIEDLHAGPRKKRGAKRVKAVAGSGKGGRVKGKGKVRKNFKATKPGKFAAPKKKRYTLEEARKKFKGFDKAIKAYREFHDREPGHVDVYELPDGESAVTVDDVHAALHRTLETNYLVPWDSNKEGSYWKHEHIEGAMSGKIDPLKRVEDLPLEVWDVKRNRTIKLPNGRWYLSDWWREKKGRGEHRVH